MVGMGLGMFREGVGRWEGGLFSGSWLWHHLALPLLLAAIWGNFSLALCLTLSGRTLSLSFPLSRSLSASEPASKKVATCVPPFFPPFSPPMGELAAAVVVLLLQLLLLLLLVLLLLLLLLLLCFCTEGDGNFVGAPMG